MQNNVGIYASQISGHLAAPAFQGDYWALATTTLSGSATSVTFSGIPQNFSHLQIRMITRTDRGATLDAMNLAINSDTGSNYSFHSVYGTGTAAPYAEATSGTTAIKFYRAAGGSAASNIFGTTIIDILDYSNLSKNKTVRYLGGVDQNGSGEIEFGSGCWYNRSVVSSLTFTPFVGTNFVVNSQFALYGVK